MYLACGYSDNNKVSYKKRNFCFIYKTVYLVNKDTYIKIIQETESKIEYESGQLIFGRCLKIVSRAYRCSSTFIKFISHFANTLHHVAVYRSNWTYYATHLSHSSLTWLTGELSTRYSVFSQSGHVLWNCLKFQSELFRRKHNRNLKNNWTIPIEIHSE